MCHVYSKIYLITNVMMQYLIYVCILFLSRNKYLNVKNLLIICYNYQRTLNIQKKYTQSIRYEKSLKFLGAN